MNSTMYHQLALMKLQEATSGALYDAEWEGGSWMCEAVETTETLEDLVAAAKNYAECGSLEHGDLAGFPFIHFGIVQVAKGHQRRSLSVIDVGDVRFAVADDLTLYQ